MKLIPASRTARYMCADIASSASPPNESVPKHNCETCTPVRPNGRYCMTLRPISHTRGNDLACHERTARTGEEKHDFRNLFRLARLAEHVEVELVLPLRVRRAGERRVGQARIDGVHRNAVLAQCER